jgi:hypothetical protein
MHEVSAKSRCFWSYHRDINREILMSSTKVQFDRALTVLLFTSISLNAASMVFSQTPVMPQPIVTPAALVTSPTPATPVDFKALLSDTAQTSSFVVAQDASVTAEDLTAILGDAVQTSRQLKKVDQRESELKTQVIDWKQRLDAHNSRPCTYPEGHSEVCDKYEQERGELEGERERLKASVAENEEQRRTFRTKLARLKARLKITAVFLYRCRCADLGPEQAKACWDQCFDGADPRIKSCLDIGDLDRFASCLIAGGGERD